MIKLLTWFHGLFAPKSSPKPKDKMPSRVALHHAYYLLGGNARVIMSGNIHVIGVATDGNYIMPLIEATSWQEAVNKLYKQYSDLILEEFNATNNCINQTKKHK